jgi:hypothetical protein
MASPDGKYKWYMNHSIDSPVSNSPLLNSPLPKSSNRQWEKKMSNFAAR